MHVYMLYALAISTYILSNIIESRPYLHLIYYTYTQIPYYRNVIYPESITKSRNVLIASSENAIRGLLMELCDIPSDVIHEVE